MSLPLRAVVLLLLVVVAATMIWLLHRTAIAVARFLTLLLRPGCPLLIVPTTAIR